MTYLATEVRTQSPDLVHFSEQNQDQGSTDPYMDMLSRRTILSEALEQHGVDTYLLMDDPYFNHDEFLFVGQAAETARNIVRTTLTEHGLDPDNPISGGVDFNKFVRIAATYYGHQEGLPAIGPSHEFGRDQDPESAVKIAHALLERLGEFRESIERKLNA